MSQTRIISTKAEFEEEYGKFDPDGPSPAEKLAHGPSEFTRQGQPRRPLEDLDVSREEAERMLRKWFERFPGLRETLGALPQTSLDERRPADSEGPMPKQVIVVRRDLKMRKGKLIAQAAHASNKVFFDTIPQALLDGTPPEGNERMRLPIEVDRAGFLWIAGIFTKICCKAESEEQLLDIYEKAKAAGLPCCLITDVGKTEFHLVPTHTAVSIGPAMPEDVDPITGDLDLW